MILLVKLQEFFFNKNYFTYHMGDRNSFSNNYLKQRKKGDATQVCIYILL